MIKYMHVLGTPISSADIFLSLIPARAGARPPLPGLSSPMGETQAPSRTTCPSRRTRWSMARGPPRARERRSLDLPAGSSTYASAAAASRARRASPARRLSPGSSCFSATSVLVLANHEPFERLGPIWSSSISFTPVSSPWAGSRRRVSMSSSTSSLFTPSACSAAPAKGSEMSAESSAAAAPSRARRAGRPAAASGARRRPRARG